MGTATARDAWVYNYGLSPLRDNMKKTMAFFNDESSRVKKNHDIELSSQSSLISWNDSLQALCYEGSKQYYNDSYVVNALYRPFTKQFLYF